MSEERKSKFRVGEVVCLRSDWDGLHPLTIESIRGGVNFGYDDDKVIVYGVAYYVENKLERFFLREEVLRESGNSHSAF